jgi:hypothetical protein
MRGLPCLIIDCDTTTQSEIANFHLAPIKANKDVGGLQVSVDHMSSMHGHEAKQDLRCEATHLLVSEYDALRVYQRVEVTIHKLQGHI